MLRSRTSSAFTRVFDALWCGVSQHEAPPPSFETLASLVPQDEGGPRTTRLLRMGARVYRYAGKDTRGHGAKTRLCPPYRSTYSPAVEQEAVVLEPHAGDLPRAHGAQQMHERDRGVGVGETLGADVGDAVAVGVGRLRRRLEGEIGAHAVRRAEARPLADQHDRDVGAQRVRDFVAD